MEEISIEKSLQEIKEMLVKLSNDVDKIKEAVRGVVGSQLTIEGRWDYWSDEEE